MKFYIIVTRHYLKILYHAATGGAIMQCGRMAQLFFPAGADDPKTHLFTVGGRSGDFSSVIGGEYRQILLFEDPL